ncbi:hypothetical protein IAT38_001160 [Cryptococcus sp. DSM 104549]
MNQAESWRRLGIGDGWEPETIEAGPSRLRGEPLESDGGEGDARKRRSDPSRTRRRRRPPPTPPTSSPLLALLPPFLLPFVGTASAAPAPAPPRARAALPTPPPIAPREAARDAAPLIDKRVKYPTTVITPSILPTSVAYVDETKLPYLLTQHEDGVWRKAEGGWYLYGRKVATPTSGPIFADADGNGTVTDSTTNSTASAKPTYAVEEALPNGWGISSNRTSIYRVPLIAVASVIMAVVIVALIIIYVLGRRKRHRKQKRAKERLRRKALAAAGLNEQDINGSAAEEAFREKLKEMEEKHAQKKKRDGQMGLAKSKVRGWNSRLGHLRRRKGKGVARSPGTETPAGEDEDKDMEVDGVQDGVQQRGREGEAERMQEGEQAAVQDTASSEEQSETTANDNPSTAESSTPTIPTAPTPYFPPAYRPASVRSIPTGAGSSSAGPSRLPASTFAPEPDADEHDDPSVSAHSSRGASSSTGRPTAMSSTEKTSAPGYYPAPATEDGELALAVASRSDGKSRMVDPPPVSDDEEAERERIRHIATDDKRVLERLRMGGSAPPEAGGGAGGEEAPASASAPEVAVDEHGFERLEVVEEEVGEASAPSEPAESAFPPPPRLSARMAQYEPSAPPSLPPSMDTRHLLPSSPPVLDGGASAPSAPPFALDGDEDDDGDLYDEGPGRFDRRVELEAALPSAPPLAPDEDDEPTGHSHGSDSSSASPDLSSGTAPSAPEEGAHDEEEEAEGERSPTAVDAQSRNGSASGPGLFLPRYEP